MTFSHDGLRDSLTHLAAPPYFYENLRRDLATAERNRSRVTLIRFQIFPTHQNVESDDDEDVMDLLYGAMALGDDDDDGETDKIFPLLKF